MALSVALASYKALRRHKQHRKSKARVPVWECLTLLVCHRGVFGDDAGDAAKRHYSDGSVYPCANTVRADGRYDRRLPQGSSGSNFVNVAINAMVDCAHVRTEGADAGDTVGCRSVDGIASLRNGSVSASGRAAKRLPSSSNGVGCIGIAGNNAADAVIHLSMEALPVFGLKHQTRFLNRKEWLNK